MLNSFWGKFGPRDNLHQTTIINKPVVLFELITNPSKIVHSLNIINPEVILTTWERVEEDVKPSKIVNVAFVVTQLLSPSADTRGGGGKGGSNYQILLRQNIALRGYRDDGKLIEENSENSYMSLILRYVDNSSNSTSEMNQIREDFFGFVNCHTENYSDFTCEPVLTGKILAKTVIQSLTNAELKLEDCIGIGTDGCSVMLGDKNGAVTNLQKSLKNAVRCPCYNHSLNLSISKSSSVQAVRNAMGTLKDVVSFINASAKRNNVLKFKNKHQLMKLCETRWSERHDSVLRFKSSLTELVDTLDIISQWKEYDSSTKAQILKNSIFDALFVITICSLSDILSTTITLSNMLQKKSLDKEYANILLDNTTKILQNKRQNPEAVFRPIYLEAYNILEQMGTEMTVPCITGRQKNRSNIMANNPESYYRINIYLPIIDNILLDIHFRFPKETLDLMELNAAVPTNALKKSKDELQSSINTIAEWLKNLETGYDFNTEKMLL
ncbi:52 kDa repressor of the inhibitor of the protein kinase-like Protein [Tribolium castaneum]|uniref:52 kDa repressor of the inhibitor of the protein kinase-like Protein n=1 Tax=Tribolium castaneum TaxID=7070 RepID=D6WQK7_TRICA|nr:52 kDa repressor of the inhibitor of the protein kinase-like Protein [Tribolium castaneum]